MEINTEARPPILHWTKADPFESSETSTVFDVPVELPGASQPVLCIVKTYVLRAPATQHSFDQPAPAAFLREAEAYEYLRTVGKDISHHFPRLETMIQLPQRIVDGLAKKSNQSYVTVIDGQVQLIKPDQKCFLSDNYYHEAALLLQNLATAFPLSVHIWRCHHEGATLKHRDIMFKVMLEVIDTVKLLHRAGLAHGYLREDHIMLPLEDETGQALRLGDRVLFVSLSRATLRAGLVESSQREKGDRKAKTPGLGVQARERWELACEQDWSDVEEIISRFQWRNQPIELLERLAGARRNGTWNPHEERPGGGWEMVLQRKNQGHYQQPQARLNS